MPQPMFRLTAEGQTASRWAMTALGHAVTNVATGLDADPSCRRSSARRAAWAAVRSSGFPRMRISRTSWCRPRVRSLCATPPRISPRRRRERGGQRSGQARRWCKEQHGPPPAGRWRCKSDHVAPFASRVRGRLGGPPSVVCVLQRARRPRAGQLSLVGSPVRQRAARGGRGVPGDRRLPCHHTFSPDWKTMRGRNHLLHIAALLNTLLVHSIHDDSPHRPPLGNPGPPPPTGHGSQGSPMPRLWVGV